MDDLPRTGLEEPSRHLIGRADSRAEITAKTRNIIAVIGIAVVLAVNATLLYLVFTSRGQYVIWDFHPSLVAAGAVRLGTDPYSEDVTRAIQELDYGRLAGPQEDVQAFSYPLFAAYLLIPLSGLPLPWAQAAWLTGLEAVALAASLLGILIWQWPEKSLGRSLLLIGSLSFYPLVWSFILGQWSIVTFGLISLATWGLLHKRDSLAGLALGFSIVKPQITFMLVPAALLWSLARRRWKVASGLGVALALVLGLPTVLQPLWIGRFLRQLEAYAQFAPFPPPALIVAESCCGLASAWVGPLIIAAFAGAALYGWLLAIARGGDGELIWAIGMTLAAAMAIAPRIAVVNQVVLLLPIVGALKAVLKASRPGILVGAAAIAVWSAGLWVLASLPPIASAQPRYPVEHQILSPILPFSVALVWIVARKLIVSGDSVEAEDQMTGLPKPE